MNYYVYILTNAHKTVLYTGVTNDLKRRIYEHKNHLDKGSFASQYNVEYLVYFEVTNDIESAISREKQIKGWNRKRKNKLIEQKNPNWIDIYDSIL
ncbi:MAG: GIY-YIG nuclease family protein [Oscillospiraceae bacterium]|nr:GIY-YIG nuclease family protein [Oscillospiraceae bacterium]